MGDVERLLRDCGVPKYYSRFSRANIMTFEAMQRRRAMLPALIDNAHDLAKVLAALGERGTSGRDGPAPASTEQGHDDDDDVVLTELRGWSTRLRARLRELAERHADQLVSRVAPHKAAQRLNAGVAPTAAAAARRRFSKSAVAAVSAKIEKTKLLVHSCHAAITAHHRYMELSRVARRFHNGADDTDKHDETVAQLEEYETFVKAALATLQEEGKRAAGDVDADDVLNPIRRKQRAEAAVAAARRQEELEAQLAAEEKARRRAERETRRLRRRLDTVHEAIEALRTRALVAEAATGATVDAATSAALATLDAHEDEAAAADADADARCTALRNAATEQQCRADDLERLLCERDAEAEKLRWALDAVCSLGEVMLDDSVFRAEARGAQVVEHALRARDAAHEAAMLDLEGQLNEARSGVDAATAASERLLQELAAARVEADGALEALRREHCNALEAATAEQQRLHAQLAQEERLRLAVELDKEKLARVALERRDEADRQSAQLARARAECADAKEALRLRHAEAEGRGFAVAGTQTLTRHEWLAMHRDMDLAARRARRGGTGSSSNTSSDEELDGAVELDGELPSALGLDAGELHRALTALGVPRGLAASHLNAIARRADELLEENAKTPAVARGSDEDDNEDDRGSAARQQERAKGSAASHALELLRAQLTLVEKLGSEVASAATPAERRAASRALRQLARDAQGSGDRTEAAGTDEPEAQLATSDPARRRPFSVAAGAPVTSHLLRESWELVEAAAGMRMPLTSREARARAQHDRARVRTAIADAEGGMDDDSSDRLPLRTLEDDLFATQDELLRVLRALRSAAWCYAGPGDAKTGAGDESPRDPAPLEVLGQRRE